MQEFLNPSDLGIKIAQRAKSSREWSQTMFLPWAQLPQLFTCTVLVQLTFLQCEFPLLLGHYLHILHRITGHVALARFDASLPLVCSLSLPVVCL